MKEFDEYIRQGEPSQVEKTQNWLTAIGLQQVDGLTPSAYLIQQAKENIEGDITFDEVKIRIDAYYKTLADRKTEADDRTEEADKVSARIAEILSEKTFSFSPTEYLNIHRRLFTGIYKFAGRIRDYNITKKEWVLDGEMVLYASAEMLKETLEYDFKEEKTFAYKGLSTQQVIEHLAHFVAYLWQIHIFGEGNTRTAAVFLIKYLRKLGFKNASNALFAQHSWYFRNALVRANYEDLSHGIYKTDKYLVRFLSNLLLEENNELKNRHLHVNFGEPDLHLAKNVGGISEDFGAKKVGEKDEKLGIKLGIKLGKNEAEIVDLVNKNPLITITELSNLLKITKTAVENNIAKLKKQGIIERIGARRNGSWKITNAN
ncbi:MAG: Fic family protein [Prevotellaceae bacterium]|jgi:fido (protein-threonine AMPylation protein)|nr:Fic family protein [Prevotellaceae bacterium]